MTAEQRLFSRLVKDPKSMTHRPITGRRQQFRSPEDIIEANHEQRTESRHHHRRVAGYRRRPGQGLSGSQLPGRGDVALDQAEQRPGHRRGPRRHRRSRDGRARREGGHLALRTDRHAGQQCRHLHRQAVHRLHGRGLRVEDRDQPRRLLPHHAARRGRDAEAGLRPHRQHHDEPDRSADRRRADGARQSHQGRHQLGHQGARHRICREGHPRERRLAWHHQDPDARAGDPRVPRRRSIRSSAWAKSATSWRRSSTSSPPAS